MTFTALGLVNYADLWTASDHNTKIKGNLDHIAQTREIPFDVRNSFSPGTGTTATYGYVDSGAAGTPPRYQYLSFANGATNKRGFGFLVPRDWDSGEVGKLQIFYYMDAANTSDQVRFDVHVAVLGDADDASTVGFGTDDVLDHTVPDAAGEMDIAEITLTNVWAELAADSYVLIELQRLGAHANDTASGNCVVIGVRFIYDWGSNIYTALSTINTGDDWSAANHNAYVQANMESINTMPWLNLMADQSVYQAGTGSGVNSAVAYSNVASGTGSPRISGRYLGNAANYLINWPFILPKHFTYQIRIKIFYFMTSANTSDEVSLGIYHTGLNPGDDVGKPVVNGSYGNNPTVPDAAFEVDVVTFDFNIANILTLQSDAIGFMNMFRLGGAAEDTAAGNMVILGVQYIWDMEYGVL